MSRLVAALALVSTALAASACPGAPPPEPITPSAPLSAKSRAGATFLDVRELPERPRLTLIGRQGDPRPAVVAAIAAGQSPELNAALAGLLAARLEAAGVVIRAVSDGTGLRLLHTVEDDGPEKLIEALAVAMATPIRADEPALERAVAHVAALRDHPLDAPALVPLARCAARGADVASATTWRNDAPGLGRLETARREGLVRQRTAIAAVGPEELGEEVAEALSETEGWPDGTPSPPTWPDGDSHGAFRSLAVGAGRLRLDVALRVGSAVAASTVARELAGDAPLGGKLGALPQPFRLAAVEATALPRGGCLSLRLIPSASAGPVDTDEEGLVDVAAAAAHTVRVARAELEVALAEPARAFEVTREIIEAEAAVDVASRAAWWILSEPVERESRLATALAVSTANTTPASPDDEAITTVYRDAISDAPTPATSGIAGQRLAVEPGQGQLWLLVGNPCALSHEGVWDAGRAALGAAAAAASTTSDDVTIEPWVRGDGVGIVAHGGMRSPDEPATTLARRVADAAGRAYTRVSPPVDRFDQAQAAALAAFGGERGLALAAFAERASPSYPGWLAPWGHPDRLASVGPLDAEARWGDVVRGPTRVAVIANHDATQAEVALRRLERWLPPTTIGDECPERRTTEPARVGVHRLTSGRDPAGSAILGVALPAGERASAALTRAWLVDRDGPLRRALGPLVRHLDVEVVEGGGRAALAVLLQTSRDRLGPAREAASTALSSLATKPPDEATFDAVLREHEGSELRASALAKTRLGRLWTGHAAQDPPSYDDYVQWLGRRFGAAHLIVVSEGLDEASD